LGKPSTWDNAKIEKLKEMHKENKLSAKEMGVILGYSKNAVIGKLFRLGLCESKLQYKNDIAKTEIYHKEEKIKNYEESVELNKIEKSAIYEKGKDNYTNIVKGVLLWVSRLLGMMKKLKTLGFYIV
jgi:hypothetical protein